MSNMTENAIISSNDPTENVDLQYCDICMENEKELVKTGCKNEHKTCKECLDKIKRDKNTCPFCREKLHQNSFVYTLPGYYMNQSNRHTGNSVIVQILSFNGMNQEDTTIFPENLVNRQVDRELRNHINSIDSIVASHHRDATIDETNATNVTNEPEWSNHHNNDNDDYDIDAVD